MCMYIAHCIYMQILVCMQYWYIRYHYCLLNTRQVHCTYRKWLPLPLTLTPPLIQWHLQWISDLLTQNFTLPLTDANMHSHRRTEWYTRTHNDPRISTQTHSYLHSVTHRDTWHWYIHTDTELHWHWYPHWDASLLTLTGTPTLLTLDAHYDAGIHAETRTHLEKLPSESSLNGALWKDPEGASWSTLGTSREGIPERSFTKHPGRALWSTLVASSRNTLKQPIGEAHLNGTSWNTLEVLHKAT